MSRAIGGHIGLTNVTHRYRHGKANAVEDITMEFKPGDATALIGRSGCGKSTLLHIMSGLMRPTSGQVVINGDLVEKPSPRYVVMFQQASLYPWMTVRQNVSLGLRFTGRMGEAASRVPSLLEMVELSEYADRNVQDLSGGQQQRVALARSLAVHPEIIFLDEPFSSLDTFTRSALQRDVRRITKDLGITMVLVTHDITEAVIMADRAIVMAANPGRISSDIQIQLADKDRQQPGTAFQKARDGLRDAFETVASADGMTASVDEETSMNNGDDGAAASGATKALAI